MVSGASNVLIAVLAARLLAVASFGLFGIVFLIYTIAIGISRALVSEPLLVHPVEAEERPGEVIGSIGLLSLGLAALLLVVSVGVRTFSAPLGDALMVLAGCLPLLVLQDLGRYLSFAAQRPGFAILLDTVWLAIMLGFIVVLLATDTRSLAPFVAAWAGAGAIAGLVLFARYGAFSVRLGLAWLRYTWSFSWRYLTSYTSMQGAQLGATAGLGAIAGARALGGANGALLLTRPFTTFISAVGAASVGEVRRSTTTTESRRHVARATYLSATVAVLNGVAMVILPSSLGKIVLGPSWYVAQPLLLPAAAGMLCLALATGVRAGLLGMRQVRQATAINVASSIVLLLAAVCGSLIDGARGGMWAIALGWALLLIPWWITFSLSVSRAQRREAVAAPLPPMPVADVRQG